MKSLNIFRRFLIRFRYPMSMPEDVANDLGLEISNLISFNEFISRLTNPDVRPKKLTRFMPRSKAEGIFNLALRREKFSHDSLFSYHFNGGWMEFMLSFDQQSRLRRIYVHHKDLKQKHEIPISR